jgi:hypothetical protein
MAEKARTGPAVQRLSRRPRTPCWRPRRTWGASTCSSPGTESWTLATELVAKCMRATPALGLARGRPRRLAGGQGRTRSSSEAAFRGCCSCAKCGCVSGGMKRRRPSERVANLFFICVSSNKSSNKASNKSSDKSSNNASFLCELCLPIHQGIT